MTNEYISFGLDADRDYILQRIHEMITSGWKLVDIAQYRTYNHTGGFVDNELYIFEKEDKNV